MEDPKTVAEQEMKKYRIAFGCDHAGFSAKTQIIRHLEKLGHKVDDLGCFSEEPCDYPDYAKAVAEKVSSGEFHKGVLACGSGIGMAIAANKFPKVRAAVVWDENAALTAASHNIANVLCLPVRRLPAVKLKRILTMWLKTPSGGGRHLRRVKKITALERQVIKKA